MQEPTKTSEAEVAAMTEMNTDVYQPVRTENVRTQMTRIQMRETWKLKNDVPLEFLSSSDFNIHGNDLMTLQNRGQHGNAFVHLSRKKCAKMKN